MNRKPRNRETEKVPELSVPWDGMMEPTRRGLLNPNAEIQVVELRLQNEPPAAPPANPPAQPAEPPAPPAESSEPIVIQQFEPDLCLAGAMEDGETYGTVDLGDGVTGITCKRDASAQAEVQSLQFDPTMYDEASASAWAQSNEFMAWCQNVARRHLALSLLDPRVHSASFQEEPPGQPMDPESPRVAEGMETFRLEVLKAIDERGWSYFVTMEPEYDFAIQELWPESMLVIDTRSGCYYMVGIAVGEDGSVTLGEPAKADITVTPAEGETLEQPMAAGAMETTKLRVATLALVSEKDAKSSPANPLYRVLVCQSGWTKDGRYITDDCLREAVALGKFDGAKCWYEHPEPGTGGERKRLAVGFVKPGSVTLQDNRAGHVDVLASIALMKHNADAVQVGEWLDQSLDAGVPFLGASVYCREVESSFGQVDGRQAQIYSRFLSPKVAVDFVEEAAFPRATVTDKLAASASKTEEGNEELTMSQKTRLAELEKKDAERKTQEADAALAKKVDAELQATGWPAEFKAAQRPILLGLKDPNLRAAQISTMNLVLGIKPGTKTATTSGPTDDKGSAGDFKTRLSPTVQKQIAEIAASRGIKVENLQAAELKVLR